MSNSNMKNADMPANPTPYMDQDSNGGELYCDNAGLTKREMFAMNADVGGVEFESIRGLSRFLEREINEHDDADLIKAGLELKAKLKVMAADALLAELEK